MGQSDDVSAIVPANTGRRREPQLLLMRMCTSLALSEAAPYRLEFEYAGFGGGREFDLSLLPKWNFASD